MASHMAIIRLMCTICGTEFKSTNVDKHLKIHAASPHCEALLCGFTNSNPETFLSHLKGHLHKRYECSACGDIYGNAKAYKEHRDTHKEFLFIQKTYYQCTECNETFYPADNVETQMKQHQWHQHGKSCDAGSLPVLVKEEYVKDNNEEKDSKTWFNNNGDDDDDDNAENLYSFEAPSTPDLCTSNSGGVEDYAGAIKTEKEESPENGKRKKDETGNGLQDLYEAETSDDADDSYTPSIEEYKPGKMSKRKRGRPRRRTSGESADKCYVCKTCDKMFKIKAQFIAHEKTHSVVRHSCETCGEKFQWKYELTAHEKIHERHACKMCEEVFDTKDELYEHEKNHNMFIYSCARCDTRFKALKYLKAHLKRMHNETLDEPEAESKDSSGEPDKKLKVNAEVGDEAIACDQCDKVFKTFPGFKNHHQEQHSDVYRRLCSLCGERFKTTTKYTKHMRMHNSIHECPTCHKFFPSVKKLKGHMNSKGCHRCEECGMLFKQRYNLIQHRTVHTGEKPFKCSLCPKTFRQKYYLEDHMRVHRGDRRYVCSDCGFKFVSSTGLSRHRRIHTGAKPFICNECGKSFTLHPNLQRHLRIHRGEKYSCPLCDRKITEKSNLAKHLKVHEKRGEKVPAGHFPNAEFPYTFSASEAEKKLITMKKDTVERTEKTDLTVALDSWQQLEMNVPNDNAESEVQPLAATLSSL